MRKTEESILPHRIQFEDMIRNDELIEHARYVDHYYGNTQKNMWKIRWLREKT